MRWKSWLVAFFVVSSLIGCSAPPAGDGKSQYAPYSYDWRRYNLRDH